MSEVTIEWTQRVAGKLPGYVERVERTAFVEGILKNNRAKILIDHAEEASWPADAPGQAVLEDVHNGLEAFYVGTVPEEFVPEATHIDEDHARVAEILKAADESASVKRTRQRSVDKNGE